MFASNLKKSLLGVSLLAIWSTQAIAAAAPKAALQALLPQVQALSQAQSVVAAVSSANSSHATLTKMEIRTLGRQWHEGLQGKPSPVLTTVNGNALTQELQSMVAGSKGVYTGILVTDQKGLIIGQTYNAKHYAEDGQGLIHHLAMLAGGKEDGVPAGLGFHGQINRGHFDGLGPCACNDQDSHCQCL